MMQKKLSLANLKDLDFGIVDAAFQRAVAEVSKDCSDRPGLDVDRVVQVVFKIRPTVNKKAGTSDGDRQKFTASVHYSVPKKVTQEYTAVARADGSLFFRADEPADPEAEHLFDPQTGEVLEKGEDGKPKLPS